MPSVLKSVILFLGCCQKEALDRRQPRVQCKETTEITASQTKENDSSEAVRYKKTCKEIFSYYDTVVNEIFDFQGRNQTDDPLVSAPVVQIIPWAHSEDAEVAEVK